MTADPGAELDSRIRRLLDKEELSELLLSFGAALDARDWDAYADNYLEDGSFEISGVRAIGREQLRALPERGLGHYHAVQHYSANHRIEVEGDEARATHYLIAVHLADGARPSVHADVGGRYDCRCVRTADGWKFAEVKLTVVWTAGERFAEQSL